MSAAPDAIQCEVARGQLANMAVQLASKFDFTETAALNLLVKTGEDMLLPSRGNRYFSPDESPVVPAHRWRLESGTSLIGFWCPACRQPHAHYGDGDNGRWPADCHDQRSPFLGRSYKLVNFGAVSAQLAVPRLLLPELTEISRRLSRCDRIERSTQS